MVTRGATAAATGFQSSGFCSAVYCPWSANLAELRAVIFQQVSEAVCVCTRVLVHACVLIKVQL